ncbi:probable inactive purple acid phosphatase 2 [Amaranthus tricolor]|uniref:probable inactive purple acid phosphatase 2 n=1 Tax=Amaranthus tricolor TaxID=29722 RepID=UPI00258D2F1F|nr:probable inactive purple acid phosphatase 2 [Amaranthus tricolor]
MIIHPYLLLHFLLFFVSSSIAAPTITISPTLLTKSGDTIKVDWSNIPNPSKLDWLGIYSPPNSPNHHFIGYFFLSSSPTWESGSGSLSFPLINLRHPYQFRIFRWTESEVDPTKMDHDKNPLPRSKHLLVQSKEVTFEKLNGPEQVHLSFTDRDDEMRVMFIAGDGGKRFVKYGEDEKELKKVVETTVERYEIEHMCDAPANQSVGWRDPGFVHHGVMSNLKKGKRYYYKVGSDSGGWSPTFSFVSRNEDSDETIAFMFGDMGTATPYRTFIRTQDESISTVKWILRDIEALGNKPAFISHIGDISYARGYSWIWDNFFNQIEPVASKVAYHVCIGNHEYDWPLQPWKPEWAAYAKDGGGECGVPYSLKFKMPGNSSFLTGTRAPATRNLYYSFDMGSVHFVYFSTETEFLEGSVQYNFLKHDLENVNRAKTPFVVVQGHRPMYTTSNELRDAALREKMQTHLEPLLVKNNVTLALWGHVHRYERFCPLNKFSCGQMGEKQGGYPVHVVIGMAGQDWQPIWQPRPEHTDMPVFPQPKRSQYRGGEFGYTRLVATKETLTLSYVGNHDGEVHDMVEILATGEVLSGGDLTSSEMTEHLDKTEFIGQSASPIFFQFVKGGSVLLLGAFVGYVIGFVSRSRKDSPTSGNSWLPVKTTEDS